MTIDVCAGHHTMVVAFSTSGGGRPARRKPCGRLPGPLDSINRLVDVVFHATVTLETVGGTTDVDARPSDALNLAALTGAPVTVESSLLFEVDENATAAWRDLPGRGQIVDAFRESRESALRHVGQRNVSHDEG